jgi:hypothetical protein
MPTERPSTSNLFFDLEDVQNFVRIAMEQKLRYQRFGETCCLNRQDKSHFCILTKTVPHPRNNNRRSYRRDNLRSPFLGKKAILTYFGHHSLPWGFCNRISYSASISIIRD